jgi:predicted lipoprotein with Yx(FWY)xxD motif
MRRSVLVFLSIALASCGGTASGVAAPKSAASAASQPAAYATPGAQATSADSSSGGYADYYGYGTPAPKAASPGGPLQLVDSAKLGKVLAASNGLTLYTNKNDTPKSTACSGACAQIWPPLLTTSGVPAAPNGLKGTLGVVTWSDGTVQVTSNGQPLYLYAGDFKPGDANGDGIDGIWSAAKN